MVKFFTVFSVLVNTSFNRLLQTPCWQQVVTLQNVEIFTVFFGPPSPKTMVRQGRGFLRKFKNAFQTERQIARFRYRSCGQKSSGWTATARFL
jgi:hypothetical protein